MQVYASYKYPRTEIENLRPGKLLQQATDSHPSVLFSSKSGDGPQLGPFHMKPATLISHVKEVIKEEEESAADKMLRRHYCADRVEDLEMSISHSFITASPFYVPAYVLRSHHYGQTLHTFVSGVDAGGVDGQRPYNVKIPAVLTGLTVGACILFCGGSAAFDAASTWIWGIALPMSIVGIFTHFLPCMRLAWVASQLREEKERHARQNAKAKWDAKGVRAYSQYEEQRRLQDRERSTFFAQNPGYGQSLDGGAAKSPDAQHSGTVQRLAPGETPSFCAK
ncbi:g6557 [Coccomyxa viridis]|uniref:G6557 protein n=1 Tax=Coccomyxa viridis TaxID=1274662 RepID=A0ABP1FVP0_9CHLO